MKIIRQGKISPMAPPWWVDLNFLCKACGCIFTCQVEDASRVYEVARITWSDPARVEVSCPHCESSVRLSQTSPADH